MKTECFASMAKYYKTTLQEKKKKKIRLKMHLCFQNQASFESSFSIRDFLEHRKLGICLISVISKDNKIYSVFIILNAWPLTWHLIYPSATISDV